MIESVVVANGATLIKIKSYMFCKVVNHYFLMSARKKVESVGKSVPIKNTQVDGKTTTPVVVGNEGKPS